jgi:hypothetical protein
MVILINGVTIVELNEAAFIIQDVTWKDAQNVVGNLFLVAVLIAKTMKNRFTLNNPSKKDHYHEL